MATSLLAGISFASRSIKPVWQPANLCTSLPESSERTMLLLAMQEVPIAASSGCDGALERKATSELKACGYGPLGKLHCRVQDGVVELAGFVPTFFLKQMAQTVVLRVESVRGVRNKVQVQ